MCAYTQVRGASGRVRDGQILLLEGGGGGEGEEDADAARSFSFSLTQCSGPRTRDTGAGSRHDSFFSPPFFK